MSTTIRFSVKLFLAACVVAVTLGDPSRASAENYRDPGEWTTSQLHIHNRIRTKDLIEVRQELAKVRDDMKTWRTASHDPRTRREYQELFRPKLQKLLKEEQWLIRELRAIRGAIRERMAPISHVPGPMPFVPALGAPVPPGTHPKDKLPRLGLSPRWL